MDYAVLKVLSSRQSRNEKNRPLYTLTSASTKMGTPKKINRLHAHQNLGPLKKFLVKPIQLSGHTPV